MTGAGPGARRIGTIAGLALVAIVVVAAIVAVTAPANWLARWVEARTGGTVLLADAEGTVWSGSAVIALGSRDAGDRLALPGRVTWTLGWSGRLAPVLHLTHDDVLLQPVDVRFGQAGLAADAGTAMLPASILRLFGAPLNTLRPEGRCELRWDALAVDREGRVTGAGTLAVADLALAISLVRPLGSYRATWKSADGRLDWQLVTERGPLEATGTGAMPAAGAGQAGRPQLRLTIRAARDASRATVAQLNPLLDMLGRRGTDEVVIESGGRS